MPSAFRWDYPEVTRLYFCIGTTILRQAMKKTVIGGQGFVIRKIEKI
jgi:hypothetical protein